ncbi:Translation Initiation Factor 5B [Datura stramonium]|uniref:Translation Initiation Factor 5B n=1 Tax=Datura stramonium TaxID=4076 RepID=A0ABS8RNV1_DATST|nr:Translation Initiation Factor 5B [Datura stramonium]
MAAGEKFTAKCRKISRRLSLKEKSEAADAEENGVEEDEEWDAKSWDAADLNMPGKSVEDEEMDSDPQPIVKKEIKATRSAASDAAPLPAAAKGKLVAMNTIFGLLFAVSRGHVDTSKPVDRLYGWKAYARIHSEGWRSSSPKRGSVITEFKEQGINTELYYKNKDMGKDTFSIVPTSAIRDSRLIVITGSMDSKDSWLTYIQSNEVQCTVLEVKVIEGHGTTIDVILVNGVLHEGDQIVVCGMQGSYQHHKEIKAAQGIKINAQVGTPICIRQSLVDIGRIASIKHNDKPVGLVKKGQRPIKIVGSNIEEQQKMFGRHFAKLKMNCLAKSSRRSIDILKQLPQFIGAQLMQSSIIMSYGL